MNKSLVTLITAGTVFAAQASVINVNFTSGSGPNPNIALNGTASGANTAPYAYTGTTWNDLGGWNASGLSDSDGNPTTAGFTITHDASNNGGAGGQWSYSGGTPLMQNYKAFANETFVTLTLTGLTANASYNIAVVAQGDTTGQGISGSIGGGALQTSSGSAPSSTTYTEGVNFLQFTSVSADGSGNIVVDFSPVNTWTPLNGFQIESIPEPATLGLVATFGGAVVFLRRRFMM